MNLRKYTVMATQVRRQKQIQVIRFLGCVMVSALRHLSSSKPKFIHTPRHWDRSVVLESSLIFPGQCSENVKGNGKVHHRTAQEGPEGE